MAVTWTYNAENVSIFKVYSQYYFQIQPGPDFGKCFFRISELIHHDCLFQPRAFKLLAELPFNFNIPSSLQQYHSCEKGNSTFQSSLPLLLDGVSYLASF